MFLFLHILCKDLQPQAHTLIQEKECKLGVNTVFVHVCCFPHGSRCVKILYIRLGNKTLKCCKRTRNVWKQALLWYYIPILHQHKQQTSRNAIMMIERCTAVWDIWSVRLKQVCFFHICAIKAWCSPFFPFSFYECLDNEKNADNIKIHGIVL